MKKLITSLLVMIFGLNMSLVYASTIDEVKREVTALKKTTLEKFKDIKQDDWYLENVAILTKMAIVNGYDDGSFKSNNTVTKAQFIKMVMTALGYKNIPLGGNYWASGYIDKAYEKDLIDSKYSISENYDIPITREEMATIIAKTLIGTPTTEDINKYISEIKDFKNVDASIGIYVIKTCKNGIIKGYEDGTLKPKNSATRAEAATILVRLLEKSDMITKFNYVIE